MNPVPDAAAARARIDLWVEDHNTAPPHSRLGCRSPRYLEKPHWEIRWTTPRAAAKFSAEIRHATEQAA